MTIIHRPEIKKSIQDFLEVPWLGIRPDLVLHPGPLDDNGQRTWILEDPVRGNHYKLGYTEGEFLYRLIGCPKPDEALEQLYATTPLRPSPSEAAAFISMLQREALAVLPKEEVIRRESESPPSEPLTFLRSLMKGSLFYKVEILRPDRFLSKTLPWISFLWSPLFRWLYIIGGILGVFRVIQEIDLYFGSVSYLFTPQGGALFLLSLVSLKIGHEFAHAFSAKAMGLHIRSMGLFFIVIWPLLYTDTTDVWKVPDRKKRLQVSAAGIAFELAVAGMALLWWSYLTDGILRSIMFFLSSTSLITSIFINLNPFLRYDGYYYLMDLWGVDNLRSRSAALLRHSILKLLIDWRGPIPEIHPNHRALIIYAFCSLVYRWFVFISIALAVYYLLFPALGLLVFIVEIALFLIRPLRTEIRYINRNRHYIGSRKRIIISGCAVSICLLALVIPIPGYHHIPCLLLYKETVRMEAAESGRLAVDLPLLHTEVAKDQLLAVIKNDTLNNEAQKIDFDLKIVQASWKELSSGGAQGAHRVWLMAEEKRLQAAYQKVTQAMAQLEVKAPFAGKVVDVNEKLYQGAFVNRKTHLLTLVGTDRMELRGYIHETLVPSLKASLGMRVNLSVPGLDSKSLYGVLREKSLFPVYSLPNESLLDIAGGPIISITDVSGYRPRDAYYPFIFDLNQSPEQALHGQPAWIWIKTDNHSVIGRLIAAGRKHIGEQGIF